MAVRAQADKRFKRARVQVPRTRGSWRAWAVACVKGGAFLVIVFYATGRAIKLLTAAPSLRIERIVVHGNRQLSQRDVLGLLHGLRGTNVLEADLDGWRTRLLASAWIKEASLRRELPGMIEVTIAERDPLGIGRIDDKLYLVATDGVVIDSFSPKYAAFDLPLIDGLHAGPRNTNGLLVDDRRAALATDVLHNLQRSADLAGRVSQIDVSNDEDAVVLLADDSARVHLGREQFSERLREYLDLAPTLRARVPAIDYVDMRFDPRLFVRPIGRVTVRPVSVAPPGAAPMRPRGARTAGAKAAARAARRGH
jgi:cell division protein FtsQ